jgi:phosphatidylethanolamine-binding protein (PEBP) family uncharacterized protein
MLMWACSPDAMKIIKNTDLILKKLSQLQLQKTKKHTGGGSINITINITIRYAAIGNNNIANNSDLTREHLAGKLNNEPNINLEGVLDNQKYLIIMQDPDAPNGMGNSGNHIYVHWIFTQSGNNTNSRNTIVTYQQPSPPAGTHRYEFYIYNGEGITDDQINALKASERQYNDEVINSLEKIQHNTMLYKVSAS